MLSNSNQKLNIWLNQKNKFDYKEFVTTCIYQNIDPLDISEFAQKVGMLSVAMVEYPHLKPDEAYLELIKRINSKHSNNSQSKSGCSGCNKDNQISDGGKVI